MNLGLALAVVSGRKRLGVKWCVEGNERGRHEQHP